MAGFFGFFDYTKPGPGIPKDAPPKPRIVVFFEILSRKFWNLVKMNIMFTFFNIPALIGAFIATWFIMQRQLSEDPVIDMLLRAIFGSILICIPVITVGPAQAGYTYVLRNYAREEHAFLWGDFKEHALKNFKQSMIISLIDFLVVVLFGVTFNFYMSSESPLAFMAGTFILISFVIFVMMHMYIYPMLITFKLTIKQIYKNAFIFAVAKLFQNLGILLLCMLIIVATFYFTVIGMILFPLITVSLTGLITNYYVYPYIKKYMIDKAEGSNESKA